MQPFLGVARSLTGRVWRARAADERIAQALSQRLGAPDIVGRVLAARGLAPEQADAFLNPSLRQALPDPSHLKDMDAAAARVARAIQAGEQVCVFGDYDVDGATSAALLKRFFDAAGGSLRIYIPDRRAEGYGPNAPALLKLREEGVSLVLTVDCGVTAFEPLEAAARARLDVVVLDHHQAEPRLPRAYAVVNPNRVDETSPHRQLAAVGVVFLLAVAANRALRRAGWWSAARPEPDLLAWLDLVALGTVADVVPLTGLNRVLVFQGLKVMAQWRNPGLAALADAARLQTKPTAFHLGFLLGPRVNAGGRVGKADLGARLLTTEDAAEALALAAELDRLNGERQAIEAIVLEQAEARVDPTRPLAFVAAAGWHEGVIGIVASRLKEKHRRPAIVVALDGGRGKGSGRSVTGLDLGAAITAAKQAGLLLNGGGHAMAAGLTVEEGRLAALTEFLTARCAPLLAALGPSDSFTVDGALHVRGVTRELVDVLEAAGPYGSGWSEPRFAVAGAEVAKADVVGTDHVRLILRGSDGGRLKAIAFRAAATPLGQGLLRATGERVHLAGCLRPDDWNGNRGAQLVVEDAAIPREAALAAVA
jgi:single-stranded-DNA-specific exonuclease